MRSNWNSREPPCDDRARRAERDGRVAGPRVEEDVALRVGRDAGRFTHVDVVGELQEIRRLRVERNLGNRELRGDDAPPVREAATPTSRDRMNRFMVVLLTASPAESSAPVSD